MKLGGRNEVDDAAYMMHVVEEKGDASYWCEPVEMVVNHNSNSFLSINPLLNNPRPSVPSLMHVSHA